jgi:hypothetical protein
MPRTPSPNVEKTLDRSGAEIGAACGGRASKEGGSFERLVAVEVGMEEVVNWGRTDCRLFCRGPGKFVGGVGKDPITPDTTLVSGPHGASRSYLKRLAHVFVATEDLNPVEFGP